MPTDINDSTVQNIVDRLTNYTQSAEGSVLPPIQRGRYRVPFVSGLKIVSLSSLNGSNVFTLSWLDVKGSPSIKVDHYNIYYTLANSNTTQPVGPFTVKQSPAQVVVDSSIQTGITFIVQTVLTNGMTSDLSASPTTAYFTVSPFLSASALNTSQVIVDGLTLTNNSPGAGQVAWSACTVYYAGVAYSIAAGNTSNKLIYWTVGNTTFSAADSYAPATNIFGIASNTSGTGDITWNKVGASSVQEAQVLPIGAPKLNLPWILIGPNGSLSLSGITFTNNPGSHVVTWSSGTAYYQGQAYAISSGATTSAQFWIYWKLSSPNVLQASATYPNPLGPDDFLIGLNGSEAGGTVGYFQKVIELHDTTGEATYLTSAASMFGYNAAGNQSWAVARSGADPNGYGVVRLFDGVGNQSVIISGNDSSVQLLKMVPDATVRTAQSLWFPITLSSGTFYLRLWQ